MNTQPAMHVRDDHSDEEYFETLNSLSMAAGERSSPVTVTVPMASGHDNETPCGSHSIRLRALTECQREAMSRAEAGKNVIVSLECPVCNLRFDHVCGSSDLKVKLMEAIHRVDVDAVRELLKELNPNLSVLGKSPICRAAGVGNLEIFKLLLDAGARPDTPNYADPLWERRPVHIVASKGFLALLQLLIERGADINQRDSDDRTALHWAAMYGNAHMIKWMVRAGASTDLAQRDGFTPLHTAACLGHTEVCKELIECGANISRRDKDGWSPLHTAVCYGFSPIAELLIERGADPLATTSSNNDNLLHIVCSKGNNVALLELLIKHNVPIEGRNLCGSTPLISAVYYNQRCAIHFLLKAGADVNATNNQGASPIYLAATRCEMTILNLLIDAGCRIHKGISLPIMSKLPSLGAFLEDKTSKPQSLTDLCLLSIRHCLAPRLQEKVSSLPLPGKVKDCIALKHLEDMGPPSPFVRSEHLILEGIFSFQD